MKLFGECLTGARKIALMCASAVVAAGAGGIGWSSPPPAARSQQVSQDTGDEVVANLCAGRAVILVAKDGIAVATLEARAEANTRPPLIVPISGRRIAVLLGAAEWIEPFTGRPPVRMEIELRKQLGQAASSKSLRQEGEASDLEEIGLAFLEPLRAAAARLHSKLELSADEDLIELLLIGYAQEYGPEVWSLHYRVVQEALRGDYYRTRVLRPHFSQLYPPEKGQPRTLVEVRYPETGAPQPTLLDLLKANDPRLGKLRAADPQFARAAERIEQGEAAKLASGEATQFLRAALNILSEENARQMILVLSEQRGFEWVLGESELTAGPIEEKSRESGAPTLRKKP